MTNDHTTSAATPGPLAQAAGHAVVAVLAVPVAAQAAVLYAVVGTAAAARGLRGLLRSA